MKNIAKINILILLGSKCYAQNLINIKDNVIKDKNTKGSKDIIDPRKFVKIYEQRKNNYQASLIGEYPMKQYLSIVDSRSCILVNFDLQSIIEDQKFSGSLSLMANINNREVQIDGYTKIGEKEKLIGLSDAFSSYDFASSLVGMLQKAGEYDIKNHSIGDIEINNKNNASILPQDIYNILGHEEEKFVIRLGNRLKALKDSADFRKFMDTEYNQFYNTHYSYNTGLNYIIHDKFATKSEIISDLESLVIESKKRLDDSKLPGNEDKTKQNNYDNYQFDNYLTTVKNQFPIFKEYVDYFIYTNPYAQKALSTSMNRDPVFIQHIIKNLFLEMSTAKNLVNKIDSLHKQVYDSKVTPETFKIKGQELFKEAKNNLDGFNNLIKDLKSVNNSYVIGLYKDSYGINAIDSLKTKIKEQLNSSYFFVNDENSEKELLIQNIFTNDRFRKILIDKIAGGAAENSFSALNTGTIDLEQLDAKEGDVVKIYVVWNKSQEILRNDLSRDSLRKNISLPIISVRVKDVGWRVKPIESFFLINRIHPDINDEDISPSRFKGAPGGSLLITYNNDHRKFQLKNDNDDEDDSKLIPDINKKLQLKRIGKLLQPSFGINVSYVDFDTKKDFEVGVGLVCGLFRNAILFTYGYDLSAEKHPYYFGIGLSFGQVYENIKTGFKYGENK